jgi:hypothetical protein
MALPSAPNSISAGQIRDEFGATSGTSVSLGAYRVSQIVSELSNLPLDDGIPQSGPISFGNFRSKKLNIVVDCGGGTRINAKSRYDNNTSITVIGNFTSRPASAAGKRVIIHTNGTIGSDQKNVGTTYCSLSTGSWDATTDLVIDIGSSGGVYGAGGDGGGGGAYDPTTGQSGTSALGVILTNNTIINNRGTIAAGGGGGGGGGGALQTANGKQVNGFGGGGGGGNGFPAGSGGGGSGFGETPSASGSDGSLTAGGSGGNSGVFDKGGTGGTASGGGGGAGGTAGDGSKGGDGSFSGANRGNFSTNGADGGSGGYAIVVNGSGVSINGNRLIGSVLYNTDPG